MLHDEVTIDDPRVLRAIAHPTRMQLLDLFETAGSQRAADVALALGIPANQASFHLRQLAKYGLVVEAPEEARDGRDRVWRLASKTPRIDARQLARTPGGRAALETFRAQWAPQAHAVVDRVAGAQVEGQVAAAIDQVVRLSDAEARALLAELREVVERWAHRGAERAAEHPVTSEIPAGEASGYEILVALVPEAEV